MFFFLTVKLMFLFWNWEKVKWLWNPYLGAGKLLIHQKIVIERKQLCKEWAHAIVHTACGDDNNNNNTHLFSLLSVSKFKHFLLNFLIKHMVTASLCTVDRVMDALRRLRIAKLTLTTRGITNSLLMSSACSIRIWSTLAPLNLIRWIF